MLFNSYVFIFLFLPFSLLGYFLLRQYCKNGNICLSFLAVASLFFYGWWNASYVLIIIFSILINYGLGRSIISLRSKNNRQAKYLLILGVILNLSTLAYFKYANFILDIFLASNSPALNILLPLAISFFTFQQIAYLVDAFQGKCEEYSFVHYSLFVTFFPQLIAGPIVHHAEIMPQFSEKKRHDFYEDLYIGISFFVLGLAKKVIFADSIAEYATPVFQASDAGQQVHIIEAWGGTLAYSLQLYFDFSGYADMAIGAARMFGIKLPLNFNSPYKATSIIDFWRRWHITLSRFLKDYLYIPLGGNRHGAISRYRNLMITMLLGGLWHGAGWNFVIWGGLHGFYLIVNHVFRKTQLAFKLSNSKIFSKLAWTITFFGVTLAWVFFRAETFEGALGILHAMFTISENTYASSIWDDDFKGLYTISLLFGIVLTLPNSQQIVGYHSQQKPFFRSLYWKPSLQFSLLSAFILILVTFNMLKISPFLYFQF